MYYPPHIALVYAHAKSHRSAHHLYVVVNKVLLRGVTHIGAKPCVKRTAVYAQRVELKRQTFC